VFFVAVGAAVAGSTFEWSSKSEMGVVPPGVPGLLPSEADETNGEPRDARCLRKRRFVCCCFVPEEAAPPAADLPVMLLMRALKPAWERPERRRPSFSMATLV
jgi:hypothetical protein